MRAFVPLAFVQRNRPSRKAFHLSAICHGMATPGDPLVLGERERETEAPATRKQRSLSECVGSLLPAFMALDAGRIRGEEVISRVPAPGTGTHQKV